MRFFYAILTLCFTPALKRNNLQTVEQSAAANSHLIEIFRSIPTVKSYAAETAARWKQENHLVKNANLAYRGAWLEMALAAFSSTIHIFAHLLLFWFGAHLVMQGELSVKTATEDRSLRGLSQRLA